MAFVFRLIGTLATVSGWIGLLLGGLFALWFGWNFQAFFLRPNHHGELHWGVVAAIFYATPAIVLLGAGSVLVCFGALF